jgi:hypothetical protein
VDSIPIRSATNFVSCYQNTPRRGNKKPNENVLLLIGLDLFVAASRTVAPGRTSCPSSLQNAVSRHCGRAKWRNIDTGVKPSMSVMAMFRQQPF